MRIVIIMTVTNNLIFSIIQKLYKSKNSILKNKI
jgi:hypothetical protein